MDWFDFVLERYNYWIVIILMMTGLYTVYARGNLVKKVVGLNLFQTSVFIFYITIGKIAGGTAPIYIGGELDHGDGHGEGHGEEGALHEGAGDSANTLAHTGEADVLRDKVENALAGNDLKAGLEDLHGGESELLHAAPHGDADKIANVGKLGEGDPAKISNEALAGLEKPDLSAEPSLHEAPAGDFGKIANDAIAAVEKPAAGFTVEGGAGLHGADAANAIGDTLHQTSEVIYTNPLPHVLILTAIVVGVATTAVGLALAVRIREAYGTIEEDELEAIDNVAEFGAGVEAAS